MNTIEDLRAELAAREKALRIKEAASDIACAVSDLIRSITKGDGGAEFASKSAGKLAAGIVALVEAVAS